MNNKYYSDWDRWFAKEHDGTPVEWTVCEVTLFLDGEDTGHLSLCPSKGPTPRNDPEQPEHSIVHQEEEHKVLHRFTASSAIEAGQKQHEVMGWGAYKPHPDWDDQQGQWKD